jgi:cation transport regulator ChaB
VPKTTREGKPKQSELPDTIKRSPAKAQRTFAKVHDAAADQYGEGERAHRTAFAALKHSFEKVGDRWEPKKKKGPSDSQAAKGGRAASKGGATAGGVDANASKAHLMDLARRLDVPGRSRMTKGQLVKALQKANSRATSKATR